LSDSKLRITADNVGDCSAEENFTSAKNLCMAGYDKGYAAGPEQPMTSLTAACIVAVAVVAIVLPFDNITAAPNLTVIVVYIKTNRGRFKTNSLLQLQLTLVLACTTWNQKLSRI
jgi:hypothetical protein